MHSIWEFNIDGGREGILWLIMVLNLEQELYGFGMVNEHIRSFEIPFQPISDKVTAGYSRL